MTAGDSLLEEHGTHLLDFALPFMSDDASLHFGLRTVSNVYDWC